MNESPFSGSIAAGADIGAFEMVLAIRTAQGHIEYCDIPLSDNDNVNMIFRRFRGKVLPSVGCGAWRLSETWSTNLGVLIEKHREPVCIWAAIEYNLSQVVSGSFSAYRYDLTRANCATLHAISSPFPSRVSIDGIKVDVSLEELNSSFPILLVNVKTGTSFYRLDSPSEFVRVGGSSIGLSTVGALSKSLAGCESLAACVALARKLVHPSEADLLVSDIYGGDCDSIGLPGNIIASCFGKANNARIPAPDMAKSLLDLICINTAQLTNLHASLHGCKQAVIVGSIGEVPELTECIQRVLAILSKGKDTLRAVYLEQSRYLGCLGALLRREKLVAGLSETFIDVPVSTATVADGFADETYTHLRVISLPIVHRPT